MQQPDRKTETQPDPENDHGHGSAWLVWTSFAFLVYLLAVGPAVKLARAVPQSGRVLAALYFWVDPLARTSPQFNAAVGWYVKNVWRVK